MTKEVQQQLIDLQSAHITQITHKGQRGAWKVRKNITSEDLFELPANLSDEQAFGILNQAQKYELIAFNAGIKFQKDKQNTVLLQTIEQLKKNIVIAREENERLASALERHIISKE